MFIKSLVGNRNVNKHSVFIIVPCKGKVEEDSEIRKKGRRVMVTEERPKWKEVMGVRGTTTDCLKMGIQ